MTFGPSNANWKVNYENAYNEHNTVGFHKKHCSTSARQASSDSLLAHKDNLVAKQLQHAKSTLDNKSAPLFFQWFKKRKPEAGRANAEVVG
jgi:hypothetical protein